MKTRDPNYAIHTTKNERQNISCELTSTCERKFLNDKYLPCQPYAILFSPSQSQTPSTQFGNDVWPLIMDKKEPFVALSECHTFVVFLLEWLDKKV